MTTETKSLHTPGPWEYDGKFTVTIPHVKGHTAFRTNPEDARVIAAAPELLAALIEMRNACTAAMRVVADLDAMHLIGADADTRQQRFVDELKASGVVNGFGVRADAVIAKAEGRAS